MYMGEFMTLFPESSVNTVFAWKVTTLDGTSSRAVPPGGDVLFHAQLKSSQLCPAGQPVCIPRQS